MNDAELIRDVMKSRLEDSITGLKTVLACVEMNDGGMKCSFCRSIVESHKMQLEEWLQMYDQLKAEEVNK
jgi:hypothetical protein